MTDHNSKGPLPVTAHMPLSARVASRAQLHRYRCRHTSSIAALRDEIFDAMDDGWSRRAIWQALYDEGRIAIKYRAFLRYLADLLKSKSRTPSATTRADECLDGSPTDEVIH